MNLSAARGLYSRLQQKFDGLQFQDKHIASDLVKIGALLGSNHNHPSAHKFGLAEDLLLQIRYDLNHPVKVTVAGQDHYIYVDVPGPTVHDVQVVTIDVPGPVQTIEVQVPVYIHDIVHDIVTVFVPAVVDQVPVTHLNAETDPVGTDGAHHLLFGAGNPDTNFQIQRDEASGLEIGLKAIYRQGDDILATGVDQQGAVHFIVPSGTQLTDSAHDVPMDNAARSAASFNYELVSDNDTIQGYLTSHDAIIEIDDDVGPGVNFGIKLKAFYDPTANPTGSHVVWGTMNSDGSLNQIVFGDDGGTAHASENSENWAFLKTLIDGDPNTNGHQDFAFGPASLEIDMVVTNKSDGDELAHLKTVHHFGGFDLSV